MSHNNTPNMDQTNDNTMSNTINSVQVDGGQNNARNNGQNNGEQVANNPFISFNTLYPSFIQNMNNTNGNNNSSHLMMNVLPNSNIFTMSYDSSSMGNGSSMGGGFLDFMNNIRNHLHQNNTHNTNNNNDGDDNSDSVNNDTDSSDSANNYTDSSDEPNNITINSLLDSLLNPDGYYLQNSSNNLFGLSHGSPFSGLMSELGMTRTNYFANANEQFKDIIGEDKTSQKLYNNCCKIMLGYNRDFVGFFTDKFLEEAYQILKEHYHLIISKLYDDEAMFVDNIYTPIIYSLYDEYKKKKESTAVDVLTEFVKDYTEGDEIKESCCICIDKINSGKYVQLPCEHEFHYNCVKKWFTEQLICPICRHNIVDKDKIDQK